MFLLQKNEESPAIHHGRQGFTFSNTFSDYSPSEGYGAAKVRRKSEISIFFQKKSYPRPAFCPTRTENFSYLCIIRLPESER